MQQKGQDGDQGERNNKGERKEISQPLSSIPHPSSFIFYPLPLRSGSPEFNALSSTARASSAWVLASR